MIEAALWYASIGLTVFRLQPGRKVPYRGTHGCNDATRDEAQIRQWWDPDQAHRGGIPNIGIPTGGLVDVIDLDDRPHDGDGDYGQVEHRGLIEAWRTGRDFPIEDMPPTIGEVETPHGMHLWIRAMGPTNSAGKLAPHIDTRGKGGYVVAPPSIVDGLTYRWTRHLEVK
jgi:hypothetical protein